MTEGNGRTPAPGDIVESIVRRPQPYDGCPWSNADIDDIARVVAESMYGSDFNPEPVFEKATKKPNVQHGWSVENRNA